MVKALFFTDIEKRRQVYLKIKCNVEKIKDDFWMGK